MHLGLEFQRKNQYPRDLILHPRESLSVSVSLSVCLSLSVFQFTVKTKSFDLDFFSPNLTKNGFKVGNSEN